jgi:16S rRNA (uracil1498-N3)-methyltransferase
VTKHLFRMFGQVEEDKEWQLHPTELHHLRVLRLRVGDHIELTDGAGKVARGPISRLTKTAAFVTAEHTQFSPPRVEGRLTLAFPALKTMEDLLPGLVEVGVDDIVVLHQEGCPRHKPEDRWHKVLISAAKQCKAVWLPTLRVIADWREAQDVLLQSGHRFLLDPLSDKMLLRQPPAAGSIVCLLGNEEGLKLPVDPGFSSVCLGPNVLRAQTAAIVAAGTLSQWRNPLN